MSPTEIPPGFCRLPIDVLAYQEVVIQNCYRLPTSVPPGQVAVDIGAHIGCFTCEALDRGFDRVFSFEADPRNFSQLCRNAVRRPDARRAELQWGAVWRSDKPLTDLRMAWQFDPNVRETNTGGGSVALSFGSGDLVPGHSLRSVFQRLDQLKIPRINFLKLDCEGSEFPILYSAPDLLDRVDRIAAELHDNLPWKSDALVDGFENTEEAVHSFLRSHGFTTERADGFPNRPYLFAER